MPVPADRPSRRFSARYHVLVIGGGAGGLTAARETNRRGARTLLVHDGPLGGDCTHTGCVPSKTLLDAAARGLSFADAIILATGARAAVPPVPGLREQPYLTHETIFDLESQPGRLAILGGGAIGVELAQAFRDLGSEVEVVEAEPRLLSREEPEASTVVEARLRARGVEVRTGDRVEEVEGREGDPRGMITGETAGFVKLIAGPRRPLGNAGGGRLLGATVVAPAAGEMIGLVALAMHTNMFTGRLAQTTQAYPTWSMAIQEAAAQFFMTRGGHTARDARGGA